MKEAKFYESSQGEKVQCQLCAFKCTISEGNTGVCGVRENIEGKLKSLVYDKVSSTTPDPIEKKPANHFAPGSRTFSICTPGCNWRCKYCQNWMLSQKEPRGKEISPKEILKSAKESGCQGISYTYTEPTIFYELSYDTAKLAHDAGLYNTYVTNGYMTPKAIRKIAPYLDTATVDLKGSGDEEFLKKFSSVPSVEPIYQALLEYQRQGIHLEITDLLVPEMGDSMDKVRELVRWILDHLGAETPLHFLRFFPAYKVQDIPPTPLATLEEAYETATQMGMKHVYVGNIGGSKNDTFCPDCGKLLIKRRSMSTTQYNIENGHCPQCGHKINIKGEKWIPKELRAT